MLYPRNLENKIGFDQVRSLLKEECLSVMGQYYVEKLRFTDDFSLLQKLLEQTREFTAILQSGDEFPSSNFFPIDKQLEKARLEGAFLSVEELNNLRLSLQTIFACLDYFSDKEEEYPQLQQLSSVVVLDKGLLKQISRVIDDRGHLRDDASPALQQIRRALIAEQSRARKTLESILRQSVSSGFSEEGVSLTIRGGRLVIPVLAEYKRKIKGFIHDESATGQTVFLEPAEVLEINNNIRELEYEEKREIVRILLAITSQVRPHVQALRKAANFLGLVDFIRAKARFALKIDAVYPQFEKRELVEWYKAVHPLLYLSHKQQQKPVVPLNIHLHQDQRILVISGPNAGGKSVALKTVALLQYMVQCGLLIPVGDGSRVGLFKNLFIDIGDEQSLENDLSTYSSHLTSMKFFTQMVDKKTLFLIDEFGTGTEPQFGGAIAESILEELNRQQAFGVINTHYGNLKQLAERTPGIVNGAMRFDAAQLEPMYQLEIGKPGSSFALEIARKIGLPKSVLQQAKEKVGVKQVKMELLLAELEKEKKEFDDKNKELSKKEKELQQAVQEYQELRSFIENKKAQLLKEAKQEASQLLSEANQRIEATIRQIKENSAEKESTRQARQGLQELKEKVKLKPEEAKAQEKTSSIKVVGGAIEEGDLIRIKGQQTVGEVMEIKGKDAEIRIGSLKSKVKLNRLEKISRKEYRQETADVESKPAMRGINLNQRMADFSSQLDVRGKRAEEALSIVDNLLDNAAMFGAPELRIVHGKGDGILRQMIREHLKGYGIVASMKDEHADRGGPGVTIVELQY
ncbi:endonuclease MutS2 [Nafulsella turpanensis]|uniref:endonuclease MutS2 n=1 Tax=Nafulsella turpanensis TaxID=1265690 RepID=UPI000344D7FB|nr:endonuclease MutS2 [Nafulsella turpanensis]